jgi:hypothetical protein
MSVMSGSGDNGKDHTKSGKSRQAGAREARLAAALRENLRRRTAQERGRAAPPGPEGAGEPPGGGKSGENC